MGSKYSRYKIFHFQEKIDSLSPEKDEIKAPIHIRIKPTNICNHSCYYCAYRSESLQLGKGMAERDSIPKEKMMEIIDDCVEMGVKAITFSGGGEPFFYKHLSDTVRRLADTDISFASLTNGSRLQGEIAELFAHNATWLRISIDGWDDRSYKEYRNVGDGEFTRVVENIRNFRKLDGKCYLGVSLIVDCKNYSHIYELTELLKDSGVESIKISPCIVSNNGARNDAYHRLFFNAAKEQVLYLKDELEDENFEVNDCYHESEVDFLKEYSWCPYLQILPVIGADLNIYSCQDKAYNLDNGLIGSIKEMSFMDFWFSDKKKFFRIDPSRVCNHHCVANVKNRLVLEYLNTDSGHVGFV